jgi:hypothetical protein
MSAIIRYVNSRFPMATRRSKGNAGRMANSGTVSRNERPGRASRLTGMTRERSITLARNSATRPQP